jgi:hypothetical protein
MFPPFAMPDYAGPLQRLVVSRTLWLVVAWPIVGFVWQALVGRRRLAGALGPDATKRALASVRNAGLCCVALATVSTLAHAAVLARASETASALYEPVARGARFGQLDAEIDLLFDPLSATYCAFACLVALGVAVFVATGPAAGRGWCSWAWLQLSLAAALVAFVADGFVGTAVGWSMAGAAAAWLAGWNDARAGTVAAMRSAIAIAAMLVGAVLLFWGLGGAWDGDDYAPDLQPRFAAVHVGGWPDKHPDGALRSLDQAAPGASNAPSRPPQRAPHPEEHPTAAGSGSLTFTGVPGATVFVDDARTASMQSPFVGVPVRAGTHALRIHSGDGSNDHVLGRVVFEEGEGEVALVPLGPTLAFRAIADQLALRDRDGHTPGRSVLEARSGPGGAAVVAASLVALLVGAGIMSGAPSSGSAPRALAALAHGATTVALGPYLIARVALLFPLAQSTWIAVESVGAAILLVAGWRAPTSSGMQRWLAFVGVAPAALGFLALGAVGITAATAVVVLSGAAIAALYLGGARDVRHTADRTEASPAHPDVERSEPGDSLVGPGSVEDLLLVRAPVRLGALLDSMDRWVVGATADTISAAYVVGAWVVARVDAHVVSTPANVFAARMVRVGRGVEPTVGVKLGRLAWALLAAVALAVLADGLWPGK